MNLPLRQEPIKALRYMTLSLKPLGLGRGSKPRRFWWIFSLRLHIEKSAPECCQVKPHSDFNHNSPIDLTPNLIIYTVGCQTNRESVITIYNPNLFKLNKIQKLIPSFVPNWTQEKLHILLYITCFQSFLKKWKW